MLQVPFQDNYKGKPGVDGRQDNYKGNFRVDGRINFNNNCLGVTRLRYSDRHEIITNKFKVNSLAHLMNTAHSLKH